MSVIIAARRTAVIPRGGAFQHLSVYQLAAPVIRSLLEQSGIAPQEVDQVIVANSLAGGGNPARLVALAAGIPQVSGISIDTQCTGGLEALRLAAALVDAGAAQIVIAGGAESYSRRPLRAKTFADGREPEFYLRPAFTPFPDSDPDMTEAAEALAARFAITRQQQDEYAIASHRKAMAATASLTAEIEKLEAVDRDVYTRHLHSKLAARSPILSGSVSLVATAIEADGAAFCLVVSQAVAKKLNIGFMTEISHYVSVGADITLPGHAPVAAINQLFAERPQTDKRRCLVEMMEAYAVQAIVCINETGLNKERVNLAGGALARGHPIGASGTILACRLFHSLKSADYPQGICAIAGAGGLGAAMLLTAKAASNMR